MNIGMINPFRYRGYYYDFETGNYYLQSRFYEPGLKRFFNADNQLNSGLQGNNMFTYCGNNPLKYSDPDGHLPFLAITGIIGAAIGAVAGGVIAKKTGKSIWKGVAIGAAGGALIGLGAGAAAGVMLAGSITATTGAVMAGGSALVATMSGGGLVAGGKMIADNVSQAVSKAPQVLWSGGEAAKQGAEKFANQVGGKTLEMTSLGQHLEKINASYPTWQAASANFANQASGTVNAFISNGAYRGVTSTFWSVEMPILVNNSRVSEVVIKIFE